MTIAPTMSISLAQVLPALQQVTEALSQLVTTLQARAQSQTTPAAVANADAGAATLGGGGAALAKGGCGCGGAEGAVAGSMGGGDVSQMPAGAAGAPKPPIADGGDKNKDHKKADKKADNKKSDTKAKAGKPSGGGGAAPARGTTDLGTIKAYIKQAAGVYGADATVLTKIAEKESTFKAGAVNDWDSNAKKGTPSKGMFQFIKPTFDSYAKSARDANPKAWEGLGDLDWMDWRQQALATSWAIENGHGSAWATFTAAGGKS